MFTTNKLILNIFFFLGLWVFQNYNYKYSSLPIFHNYAFKGGKPIDKYANKLKTYLTIQHGFHFPLSLFTHPEPQSSPLFHPECSCMEFVVQYYSYILYLTVQYYFQETAHVSNTAPQWVEGHNAPASQDSPSWLTGAPVRVRT